MRIVAFSDSHGNYAALDKVMKKMPDADFYIHLGDGDVEFARLRTQYPTKAFRGVRGNCDWVSKQRVSDVILLHDKKVFFTHGHAYNVKAGTGELLHHAHSLNANIVLFGHTHIAVSKCCDGIYLLNPGSVSLPVSGGPSFGFVDITDAGVFTSIVYL